MLETSRLILRPARISDAYYLYDLNSDPIVMKYTGDTHLASVLDYEHLIRDRMIPQFEKYKMSRFLLFQKEDETFLGWCGLKFFPETQEVDLGYRFKKKYWGQGFATEAGRRTLEYGFNEIGLERIFATVMPENIPSIKVLQKLGMTFRGTRKDPCYSVPFIFYDIKKSDFTC